MKKSALETLAFVLGLCISAVGAIGILIPSFFVWFSEQFAAAGAIGFLLVGTARVALGVLLLSVASVSRVPTALRVVGGVIVIIGMATVITGLVAPDRGRAGIEWWLHQGAAAFRLTAFAVLILGSFIAFACAPAPRTT